MSLAQLPPEVLEEIFKFVDKDYKKYLREPCKSWNEILIDSAWFKNNFRICLNSNTLDLAYETLYGLLDKGFEFKKMLLNLDIDHSNIPHTIWNKLTENIEELEVEFTSLKNFKKRNFTSAVNIIPLTVKKLNMKNEADAYELLQHKGKDLKYLEILELKTLYCCREVRTMIQSFSNLLRCCPHLRLLRIESKENTVFYCHVILEQLITSRFLLYFPKVHIELAYRSRLGNSNMQRYNWRTITSETKTITDVKKNQNDTTWKVEVTEVTMRNITKMLEEPLPKLNEIIFGNFVKRFTRINRCFINESVTKLSVTSLKFELIDFRCSDCFIKLLKSFPNTKSLTFESLNLKFKENFCAVLDNFSKLENLHLKDVTGVNDVEQFLNLLGARTFEDVKYLTFTAEEMEISPKDIERLSKSFENANAVVLKVKNFKNGTIQDCIKAALRHFKWIEVLMMTYYSFPGTENIVFLKDQDVVDIGREYSSKRLQYLYLPLDEDEEQQEEVFLEIFKLFPALIGLENF